MKPRWTLICFWILLVCGGCFWSGVKKDFVASSQYRPSDYQRVAVINLDPQVSFSEYVEAELLRRGYQVKEASVTRQFLVKEGLVKEGAVDSESLIKIANHLEVQGIVLCSVLDFSRFRDSYRLGIKMVAPNTGDTLWSAQGALEGRKGQKRSELLQEIVASSLKNLPPVK